VFLFWHRSKADRQLH